MIEIKKFKMDHLDSFECRDNIQGLDLAMLGNHMDPKVDMVSLIDSNDRVVCISGVNHLRVGVGELWIIGSELIDKNKLKFFKAIRGLISFLFERMELHRLEIAVDCEWEQGGRWAESLGFTFESVSKQYDNLRRDHAIYTRIE